MLVTASQVLEKNHAFNHAVHKRQSDVTRHLIDGFHNIRRIEPSAGALGRIGMAFAVNAAWGAEAGLHIFWPSAVLFGPTRFSCGVQNLRLPVGLGFGLGAGGFATLGFLAAGKHAPRTAAGQNLPSILGRLNFEDGLLFTPAIASLKRHAAKASRDDTPVLAAAWLWGAALVSVAATAVRLGTSAVFGCLAVGYAVSMALIAGIVAAGLQVLRSDDGQVVDFYWINQYFSEAP